MENTETEVMCVLLKILLDQGLITKSTYDSAQNMVHLPIDLPAFFEDGACWGKGKSNGCTEGQE